MEDTGKNTSQIARLLAVLGLCAAVVILIVAVTGATSGDGDSGEKNNAAKRQPAKPKTKKKVYEVEAGDTLTTISQKTGIPVGQIERLNPDLDPQALQLGQKLKLR